jgi:hypothetical protein
MTKPSVARSRLIPSKKSNRTKRLWVLGPHSDKMVKIQELLARAGEPFVYAQIFLQGTGLCARVNKENSCDREAFADVGQSAPMRIYCIDCGPKIKPRQKTPSSYVRFPDYNMVETVENEVVRLNRR